MYNQTHLVQKFLNSSFNQILLLFFSACFISFLYHLQTFFIVLNIFLHLTHIYANIFNSFFLLTLKMTEYRSKSHFVSGVIFTCTLTVFIYLIIYLQTLQTRMLIFQTFSEPLRLLESSSARNCGSILLFFSFSTQFSFFGMVTYQIGPEHETRYKSQSSKT